MSSLQGGDPYGVEEGVSSSSRSSLHDSGFSAAHNAPSRRRATSVPKLRPSSSARSARCAYNPWSSMHSVHYCMHKQPTGMFYHAVIALYTCSQSRRRSHECLDCMLHKTNACLCALMKCPVHVIREHCTQQFCAPGNTSDPAVSSMHQSRLLCNSRLARLRAMFSGKGPESFSSLC